MKMPYKYRMLFYPCLLMMLCAAFQFFKFILQSYPGVITFELTREFKLTGAGLGNLAASFYYAYIVMQLFVGILLDRFGVRKMAFLAIATAALGTFLFSRAHTLFAAEYSRALMGVGVAFSSVVFLKTAAERFSARQYVMVSGLLATASMAGAVFGETPLVLIIQKMGWRHCLMMASLLGFALACIFLCLLSDNKSLQGTEKNAGNISLHDILGVVRSRQNWLLTAYAGFAFSPFAVFGGLWGNPFLQTAAHLTRIESASMISMVFIGLGLGGPFVTGLSRYFERKERLMFFCTLTACLVLGAILYQPSMPSWLLGSLLFAFGFLMGGYMLVFSLGRDMNPFYLTGTVIAMINSGDALLTGLTEPMIGKLLDLTHSGSSAPGVFSLQGYQMALSLMPLYLFLASFTLLFVKPRQVPASACRVILEAA